MFRSRFPTTLERRAAASRGEALNPVERMMGVLDLLFAEWELDPIPEALLEVACQALLRSALSRTFGQNTGEKVVGTAPGGKVVSVRFLRDGLEVRGRVPYHLLRDLVARIFG